MTMIEINDAIKSKIKEILDKNPGKYLRLTVEGDGCAGPYYKLSLDEADPNDKIIQVNGIDILVSDLVQRLAEVSRINIFVNSSGKDL
jgi:Fe-S cluster assembly iron-binding protein IscA